MLWQAVKAQDSGAEITDEEVEEEQWAAKERQVNQSLTVWTENSSWGQESTEEKCIWGSNGHFLCKFVNFEQKPLNSQWNR